MDPALMCTSTGDGEQTIGQIQTYGERRRFVFIWSHRLTVRTSGFHPGNRGSIPRGTTKYSSFI